MRPPAQSRPIACVITVTETSFGDAADPAASHLGSNCTTTHPLEPTRHIATQWGAAAHCQSRKRLGTMRGAMQAPPASGTPMPSSDGWREGNGTSTWQRTTARRPQRLERNTSGTQPAPAEPCRADGAKHDGSGCPDEEHSEIARDSWPVGRAKSDFFPRFQAPHSSISGQARGKKGLTFPCDKKCSISRQHLSRAPAVSQYPGGCRSLKARTSEPSVATPPCSSEGRDGVRTGR